MKRIDKNKTEREEYLYHNTHVLLKKYREIKWNIDVILTQIKLNFQLEMNTSIDDFLEIVYDAGTSLDGTDIQEQIRSMERNRKMLQIIESAVNMLRKKQPEGEMYYWILYYTYLSPGKKKSTDDIINLVSEKTLTMAWSTYFHRRDKAVEILSSILWGFAGKDCKNILDDFIKEAEHEKA